MITLRFNFIEKKSEGGQSAYQLIDYKPFPANILLAMLIFLSQEIVKLDIPEDNEYKLVARYVLDKLLPK